MPSFTIASEEGAQRYGGEVGDRVELTLPRDEKRAVVAAGWLEELSEDTRRTLRSKKKEAK
jgi:hypothetical protein